MAHLVDQFVVTGKFQHLRFPAVGVDDHSAGFPVEGQLHKAPFPIKPRPILEHSFCTVGRREQDAIFHAARQHILALAALRRRGPDAAARLQRAEEPQQQFHNIDAAGQQGTAAVGPTEHPAVIIGGKGVAELRQMDFSHVAPLHPLFQRQDGRQKQHFLGFHQEQAPLPGQSKQFPRLPGRGGAGLFTQDMLSGQQSRFSPLVMLDVDSGQIHHVHIGVPQQLVMAAVGCGNVPFRRLCPCLFQGPGGQCHHFPAARRPDGGHKPGRNGRGTEETVSNGFHRKTSFCQKIRAFARIFMDVLICP